MRIDDRRRHKLRCLIGGVTEHQTLIASPQNSVCAIDPLVDILRLTVEADLDFASIWGNAGVSIGVSGFAKYLTHKGRGGFTHRMKVLNALGFEFSGNDHALVRKQGFAGNACLGISREKCVEDAIGNSICKLVGVTL
jgi:hypothetical protein